MIVKNTSHKPFERVATSYFKFIPHQVKDYGAPLGVFAALLIRKTLVSHGFKQYFRRETRAMLRQWHYVGNMTLDSTIRWPQAR